MIQNKRRAETDGGEPAWSEEMSLYKNGDSVVVGLPLFARKLHRLTKNDSVTVEVYDGGIWIDTGGDDDA